ncbi:MULTISPECIES: hypothetical protein [Chryseobacterium]|uniref:Lipoprotein n=1 Tax=Chryseobacterium taihuense TaxID=1141221 RepID=A0A4U8WFI6_9FLAO|nr:MULTISPECIES: hypothetical protein [Chryseobacterium]QQV02982.1 hypothetical protein I6I61_01060 [Chryseobacterium sp. FDAARGOS 1104]VFB03735.1 Uncharacterised protein [Chryseobacterium taihuense]
MRIFLIGAFLFLTISCKLQNNQKLESEIISLYKVNDKDIQNCKKESEELRKKKTEEWLIKNIYDQCIAPLEHLNFYRSNSLKMLEKTSNKEDFLIINFISDNITIPFDTKTILYANKNYFGIKHYFDSENNMVIEKNEEFEVSEFEKDNIEKIDEYLKTGKSEYFSNKGDGQIGLYRVWNVIARINGKVKMIVLYRIK